MKNKRQEKILEIIAHSAVETQAQLIGRLAQEGFESTQATISRDIKQLQIVKEPLGDGRYRYVAPAPAATADYVSRLETILRECIIGADCARNLVVLKTMPGLAGGAASAFDGKNIPGMLGSLAGNDTVLIVMHDDASAEELCRWIAGLRK